MDFIGETGNRTPISAVKGRRANHYTMRPVSSGGGGGGGVPNMEVFKIVDEFNIS